MNLGISKRWQLCWSVAMASVVAIQSASSGREGGSPARVIGEVTANDVYVRSGPSLNHYTVCKLNAGERVTIVGETTEWYEVLPPDEAFSLISGDYVDVTEEATGVVNGNNVRVRAGSVLNDNMYTVQLMLSKGAEVAVLGRNPDGFLRIKPPPGTTLWISRAFVEVVPEDLLKLEKELGTTSPTTREGRAAARRPAAGPLFGEDSPFAELPVTPQRSELLELDAATHEEIQKPVVERRVGPLLERYRALAAQEEDELARRYAQVRVEQLSGMEALVETVQSMRRLSEDVESQRRALLEERARIREQITRIPRGLDIHGVLRSSALYPAGTFPRRYRLVDSSGAAERTVAYIEVPEGSPLDAESFLGRPVGIRASGSRLQSGVVDPVPIYIAEEIVPLEEESPEPRPAKPSDEE